MTYLEPRWALQGGPAEGVPVTMELDGHEGSVSVEPLLAYRPARLTILETAGTLMPNSRARSAMSSPAERRRRTSSIISSVIRRGRPGENRAGFLRRRDSARTAT